MTKINCFSKINNMLSQSHQLFIITNKTNGQNKNKSNNLCCLGPETSSFN